MKFRQIGHTTTQYGQSFFPKTISAWNGLAFAEAPSLAVFRSNFLNNQRASLPHNTLEGSCGILKQNQCDLFVSFYWQIYTLGCRQLVVETDFRRAPPKYGGFDQETINSLTDV